MPQCSPLSVAAALALFIESLPKPLLPPDLYPTVCAVPRHLLKEYLLIFLHRWNLIVKIFAHGVDVSWKICPRCRTMSSYIFCLSSENCCSTRMLIGYWFCVLETKFFNNLFCFFIRLHPGKLSAASVVFMASNRDGGKDGQTRVEAMQFVISYFLTTSAI